MAKASKSTTTSDSQEILDAVNDSSDSSKATKADTSASKASEPVKDTKKKTEKDDMDKIDDRNPVVAFIYNHPWITMFGFYIILTALVRVWGWATIVFLLIPLVCFARIWMLARDTDSDLQKEDHIKLEWWAKVGMMTSIFGLASALILNWLGVLHIFN